MCHILTVSIISCVECVDTENACGWCLYSGTCSGVSDDCESSSSAIEVCPVVNSAPTPSGHYTQPVEVARDLILQTSNLPAPVSTLVYTGTACIMAHGSIPGQWFPVRVQLE